MLLKLIVTGSLNGGESTVEEFGNAVRNGEIQLTVKNVADEKYHDQRCADIAIEFSAVRDTCLELNGQKCIEMVEKYTDRMPSARVNF